MALVKSGERMLGISVKTEDGMRWEAQALEVPADLRADEIDRFYIIKLLILDLEVPADLRAGEIPPRGHHLIGSGHRSERAAIAAAEKYARAWLAGLAASAPCACEDLGPK